MQYIDWLSGRNDNEIHLASCECVFHKCAVLSFMTVIDNMGRESQKNMHT